MNLCLNGAHAIGSAAGVLQIAVGDGENGSPLSGPSVCLSVQDDGCGMDEKLQKMIFDPFFTTKGPGKGTGLGLSVVQSIVDGHGGQIRVRSRPGAGSRFEVFLPLMADPVAPERDAGTDRQAFAGHGESIMVIDDDLSVATFAQVVLERAGYKPTVFTSGSLGLQDFIGDPARYRLLVVDLSMPEMSGLEVIREVRQRRPDLPVLLISGNHHEADLSGLAADALVHFLPKPFGRAVLLGLVQKYLSADQD